MITTEEKVEEPQEPEVHFQAPAIQNNPDGWGPCELPDQFRDIPYQPFSKGDRLGKVRILCRLIIANRILFIKAKLIYLNLFLTDR